MALTALSMATGRYGVTSFRDDAVDVPAVYRPTVVMTAMPNKAKTNVNVSIKSTYPLAVEVDGKWVARNVFYVRTSLNALQSVTCDVQRAKIIDDHIAMLTMYKLTLQNGAVPTVA